MNLVEVIHWRCSDCGAVFMCERGWYEAQVETGRVRSCADHPSDLRGGGF